MLHLTIGGSSEILKQITFVGVVPFYKVSRLKELIIKVFFSYERKGTVSHTVRGYFIV